MDETPGAHPTEPFERPINAYDGACQLLHDRKLEVMADYSHGIIDNEQAMLRHSSLNRAFGLLTAQHGGKRG